MYSFRKTTRKSSVEAGGGEEEDDNNSVFSVDPEMITKLKIPIRVDQRSALDYQKMYIYQIEKDLVKIVRKHGPHARRNQNFLEARAEDPEYRTLSNNHPLGMNGEIKDVAMVASKISWQATQKPQGPIAQRKHREFVKANIVTVSEKVQKKTKQERMDKELYDSLQYGYTEERRVKKKLTAKEAEEEHRKKIREDLEIYQHEQMLKDPWKYRVDRGLFKDLRVKISKFDIARNMEGWNKYVSICHKGLIIVVHDTCWYRGHHPDHDIETGFPKVTHLEEKFARSGIAQASPLTCIHT
jgi:hypothetical protein